MLESLTRSSDGQFASAPLSLEVDPDALAFDFRRVADEPMKPQPGNHHDGRWQGLSLRSAGGRQQADGSLPGLHNFKDCLALRQTPAIAALLDSIPAPKLAVRLLRLPAGASIEAHVDDFTGFWHGVLRLHVPVHTNDDVSMEIAGGCYKWGTGTIWYGNFCLPHEVHNKGTCDRIHLVIDTLITPELLACFPPRERQLIDFDEVTFAPVEQPSEKPEPFAFQLPTAIAERFLPKIAALSVGNQRLVAAIRNRKGRSIVAIEDKPVFAVTPIDENTWRIANWSKGITVRREGSKFVRFAMRMPTPFRPIGDKLQEEAIELPLAN